MDYGEAFYEAYFDVILRAFLNDYNEISGFIGTATGEELGYFIYVLCDFIKKYPNEEIIQLCKIESIFETGIFDEEIEFAKGIVSDKQKAIVEK